MRVLSKTSKNYNLIGAVFCEGPPDAEISAVSWESLSRGLSRRLPVKAHGFLDFQAERCRETGCVINSLLLSWHVLFRTYGWPFRFTLTAEPEMKRREEG